MAIIFPVTLLIVFGIIQFGIWYHANDIARAAAQEAVRSASAYHATQTEGTQAADQVLTENSNGLIVHTRVICNRGPAVATATVTGEALHVVPFISLPVKATATAPVEAFLPPPRA
jgi:Flp pilus assembly protein TadG